MKHPVSMVMFVCLTFFMTGPLAVSNAMQKPSNDIALPSMNGSKNITDIEDLPSPVQGSILNKNHGPIIKWIPHNSHNPLPKLITPDTLWCICIQGEVCGQNAFCQSSDNLRKKCWDCLGQGCASYTGSCKKTFPRF